MGGQREDTGSLSISENGSSDSKESSNSASSYPTGYGSRRAGYPWANGHQLMANTAPPMLDQLSRSYANRFGDAGSQYYDRAQPLNFGRYRGSPYGNPAHSELRLPTQAYGRGDNSPVADVFDPEARRLPMADNYDYDGQSPPAYERPISEDLIEPVLDVKALTGDSAISTSATGNLDVVV